MNLEKNKKFCQISICIFLLCGAISMKADFWKRPFSGPGEKISTLVVTGNYAKPRIIAELIQANTRQPILLTPASGQDGIYFMPPEKNGGKAMKIPKKELTNFINFTGATQILVLGNSDYVSDKYFEKISKEQTICRITSKNWQRVANTIGRFLNIPNLPGDYEKLSKKMTNNVNYVRTEDGSFSDEIKAPEEINSLPEITPDDSTTELDNSIPKIEPFVIDASNK